MAAGPQTLGRYQLERVLGKGAMGIVYEALDPKLHRKVAIKTILVSQLDEETAKDFSMRFVRDGQGRIKLTDFGVARVTDSDRTHVERTQAGTMVGTPAYMSPEQIQGQRIDRRTDIFSAGIILYQFLTGQKPFTGEGAWTVAKALAKDPDQRFATAREFSQALKRAAEGKPAVQEIEPTLVVPRESRVPQATHPEALRSGEMELEFWRSIKDSNDPNDFELYVRQFPQGVYASLAARKAAKLRSGSPADDSGTRTMAGADRTRLQRSVPRAQAEESAQAAVEKTIKLTDAPSPEPARAGKSRSLLVPAVLGVLVAAGAVTYFVVMKPSQHSAAQQVEAEAKARRDAEAQAKREAEARAQREAEARAQREAAAELKAKRETEAQAKREVELRAKRESEAQAKRQAEAQAKRESEERAQREAKGHAQRDAETKAKLTAETSLWDSVKSSRKAADVQKYLNRYPNGQYAEAARQRLLELENARLEEAAKRQKEGEKRKSTIIVPPTF